MIQHLLVITDSMIVKHWREEWTYENPVIWRYKGDRTWVKETVPAEQVKGKWTQTIWEVADEPRYQGFSQFVNLDGKISGKIPPMRHYQEGNIPCVTTTIF